MTRVCRPSATANIHWRHFRCLHNFTSRVFDRVWFRCSGD